MDNSPHQKNAKKLHFRANGKLLITGEYLVLDGAKAFAIPTRFGQELEVFFTTDRNILKWEAYDHNGNCWLDFLISRIAIVRDLSTLDSNIKDPKKRLQGLLQYAFKQNNMFWPEGTGLLVKTRIDFSRDWGLGTSSTLSYLIAAWTGVDPFELNQTFFGGSGYDIACAGLESPLFYQLTGGGRVIQPFTWEPPFKDNVFFVYQGEKKNSRDAITNYRNVSHEELETLVKDQNEITQKLVDVKDLSSFERLITKVEFLVSYAIQIAPVKKERFKDYPGSIKSLGAWGGDFMMVTGQSKDDVQQYFESKGLPIVLSWVEMFKHQNRDISLNQISEGWKWKVFSTENPHSLGLEDVGGKIEVEKGLLRGFKSVEQLGSMTFEPNEESVLEGFVFSASSKMIKVLDFIPQFTNVFRTQVEVQLDEGKSCLAMIYI